MIQTTNTFDKLIQEREVIRANISQITDLSQEMANMAGLRDTATDITSYQSNLVNEKRVNLRHNIVNFIDGLQIHFDLGERVLRPLISHLLLQTLEIKHREILKKLSDVDTAILNLSPLGMLFNSTFLKEKIGIIFQALQNLNCQESSLLAFSGISRNEEGI